MAAVDWQAVEAAIGRLQADWTDALAEFCAIPSEGGRADDLERAAQWTTERLERIGATTRVIRIDDAPPLVVGEIGPGDAPVLNLVQHYDVQPAGDHSEWTIGPLLAGGSRRSPLRAGRDGQQGRAARADVGARRTGCGRRGAALPRPLPGGGRGGDRQLAPRRAARHGS